MRMFGLKIVRSARGAATVAVAAMLPASIARAQLADQPYAVQDRIVDRQQLPDELVEFPESYWLVSLSLEAFGHADFKEARDNWVLQGVSVMYRRGPWAPHIYLMSNAILQGAFPDSEGLRNTRDQLGLGMRYYLPLWGIDWSYGISAHLETRLADHFWLGYATPVELGAVVYDQNSWQIQAFAGARMALGGQLVNHYLIDPNGFDSESARDNLRRVTDEDPWLGFVRITFGHELN